MATLRWPERVLRPQSVAFNIAPRSLAAPSSVSGFTQVVSSDAGIWTATFENVVVTDRTKVLAWRGISALLEGRLTPILVPLCRAYQPVPDGAVDAGLYDPVPHSDDSPFDDDSEYQGRVIDVTFSSAAAKRATSANITVTYADTLQPGQHFSVGERLYRLKTVVYSSDTAAAITFQPPLREAVSIGDSLEFDDPVCRMRLASDGEMDLLLDGRRRALPTVSFIEDV